MLNDFFIIIDDELPLHNNINNVNNFMVSSWWFQPLFRRLGKTQLRLRATASAASRPSGPSAAMEDMEHQAPMLSPWAARGSLI